MARRLTLKKKILFATCLSLLTLATGLTALEVIGYIKLPTMWEALVEDFKINHKWKPNTSWRHDEFAKSNPDFPEPYVHEFNAQSWIEDYDIEKAKPAGSYRVFYVGDSFTEGTAPMDQSVPSLVGTELNRIAAKKGIGTKFEVINAGTSSYSPLIYYTLLRHVILEYAPDLVVIQVDMTDDFDDWKYAKSAIFDDVGNPWAVPPRNPYKSVYFDSSEGVIEANFWTRTQIFLVRNSYFYNYLLHRASWKKKKAAATASTKEAISTGKNTAEIYHRWSWCRDEWDEFTEQNVNRTLDALRRITELCRNSGVKLMLTAVPHYDQYASDPHGRQPADWSSRPHIEIGVMAERAGVAYLNSHAALDGVLRGTPHSKYYYNGDMHFNPRGYALWAEAQLKFMLDPRHQLLPASIADGHTF